MRHNVYGSHLSRTSGQRSLLFKSLIENLFVYKSIQTTEAKAKAVKGLVDRVIVQAKHKNSRAAMATFVKNKKALEQLNAEILPKLGSRTSGYTSVVRVGQRRGDGAMMVRMSLLLDQSSVLTSGGRASSRQSSDKGESVVGTSVKETDKPKAEKLKSENRKQKTDNRKKKGVSR